MSFYCTGLCNILIILEVGGRANHYRDCEICWMLLNPNDALKRKNCQAQFSQLPIKGMVLKYKKKTSPYPYLRDSTEDQIKAFSVREREL